jgi:hypothetical protein
METKANCEEKNTPCDYRQDEECTFWEKAELFPGAFDVVVPDDNSEHPLLEIDTYREPCLHEADKRRTCSRFINPGQKGWLNCRTCHQPECFFC